MADLGKAYVQIMPSAQGIKKQVSDILGKDLDSVSKSVGQKSGAQIVSGIGQSMGKMGSTLTRHITLPVAGAVTAIGGLVSALGWGRLTGLDSARAQLQGLGYDAEAVERISSLVNEAIQGTTTTMADGVATAAGALAAGVEEGAELERYIKLVGDAAVGAGRQTGEMAQIFNRVQGSGKLMTQELNMIEDGMPGFAMAMSESLGVTQEEFRAMVTAGEVSSDQFLDVMESFAGDMSDAFAGSWRGIVSRTKSNIGILGEIMLGGVFEQSKESLADFLEYIRTDDVRGWFADAGQAIGQAFSDILATIQSSIEWWKNLDDSVKENIITMAGIIIAAGPILTIISKLIGVVMTAHKWFGLAKVALGILSGAIGAISAPVAIVIGAIAALIAGIVYFWNTNEEFKTAVINIWNNIKDGIMQAWESVKVYLEIAITAIVTFAQNTFGALKAWWDENQEAILQTAMRIWQTIQEYLNIAITAIVDFVQSIFGGLVLWWQENNEMILQAAENVWNVIKTVIGVAMEIIWAIMQKIWPLVLAIVKFAWDGIKNVIEGVIKVITGIIEFFSALFTGNWSALWESVKNVTLGAVQALWGFIQLWIVGKIIGLVKAFVAAAKTLFSGMWTFVKNLFTNSLTFIFNKVMSVFTGITNFISSVMGAIKNVITGGLNVVKSVFRNIFMSLKGIVTSAFNSVRTAISGGLSKALSTVTSFLGKFKTAGGNIIKNIASGITGAISVVTDAVGGVLKKARDLLPFSPPKDKSSPLVDIHKNGIGTQIAKGILDGQNEVDRAMKSLLSTPDEMTVGVNRRFIHDVDGANNRPAYIQLAMGGHVFETFVDDISSEQDRLFYLETD